MASAQSNVQGSHDTRHDPVTWAHFFLDDRGVTLYLLMREVNRYKTGGIRN
jgi:hypothetical protein